MSSLSSLEDAPKKRQRQSSEESQSDGALVRARKTRKLKDPLETAKVREKGACFLCQKKRKVVSSPAPVEIGSPWTQNDLEKCQDGDDPEGSCKRCLEHPDKITFIPGLLRPLCWRPNIGSTEIFRRGTHSDGSMKALTNKSQAQQSTLQLLFEGTARMQDLESKHCGSTLLHARVAVTLLDMSNCHKTGRQTLWGSDLTATNQWIQTSNTILGLTTESSNNTGPLHSALRALVWLHQQSRSSLCRIRRVTFRRTWTWQPSWRESRSRLHNNTRYVRKLPRDLKYLLISYLVLAACWTCPQALGSLSLYWGALEHRRKRDPWHVRRPKPQLPLPRPNTSSSHGRPPDRPYRHQRDSSTRSKEDS